MLLARTSPRQQKPAHRQGFTLVEILVVVAIIALLISILLPSLAKAREMGRRAACLSNLHQQGVGMGAYVAENKGRLPVRGHFGYVISEHKSIHYPWVPSSEDLLKDPINYGQLYGKYVGKDLDLYYCQSMPKSFIEDPDYGKPSFKLSGDNNKYVTWGGYMYAAPVKTGQSPRNDAKRVFPSSIWNNLFIDPWLVRHKGYDWSNYKEYEKLLPTMQALEYDGVIGGGGSAATMIRATHGNGINSMYNDFHARFVQNGPTELMANGRPVMLFDLAPTSGQGGAPALYAMWEFLNRKY